MRYFVGWHRVANEIFEIKCSYFTLYLLALMVQVLENLPVDQLLDVRNFLNVCLFRMNVNIEINRELAREQLRKIVELTKRLHSVIGYIKIGLEFILAMLGDDG